MPAAAATNGLDRRLRRTVRVGMLLGHLLVYEWQVQIIHSAANLLHLHLRYGLLLARLLLILKFVHVRL